MKNGLIKFAKGIFVIFTIQLFLITISFVVQSCSKNEFLKDNAVIVAKNNFLNSAKTGILSLNGIKVSTVNNSTFTKSATYNEDYATISVYSLPDSDFTDFQTLENVNSLADLTTVDGTELEVRYIDGSISDNISNSQELIKSYSISIVSAKQSLQPTLVEAKNYLRSKGLTDYDIQNLLTADEDSPAMSESDLIPAVLQLIAEEQKQNSVASINFSNVFIQSAQASQIGNCAGDALGVSAIAAIAAGGLQTEAAKALLKKAIRKVASRALGWVGAAIFTYEFGDCMGWW